MSHGKYLRRELISTPQPLKRRGVDETCKHASVQRGYGTLPYDVLLAHATYARMHNFRLRECCSASLASDMYTTNYILEREEHEPDAINLAKCFNEKTVHLYFLNFLSLYRVLLWFIFVLLIIIIQE